MELEALMDKVSDQILHFLKAIEVRREKLLTLTNELMIAGAYYAFLSQTVGCSPYTIIGAENIREFLGIIFWNITITPKAGKPYNLYLDVLLDKDGWLITTEVWADSDNGGQDLIKEFSERRATNLEECWTQIDEAIEDLNTYKNMFKE